MTATILVLMVFVAPRVMARVGAKPMVIGGLLLLAAGLVGLSLARPDGSFVVDGLAAMTALASSQGADQLGDAVALTDGYSAAFLGAAGIAVLGGLIAAVTL